MATRSPHRVERETGVSRDPRIERGGYPQNWPKVPSPASLTDAGIVQLAVSPPALGLAPWIQCMATLRAVPTRDRISCRPFLPNTGHIGFFESEGPVGIVHSLWAWGISQAQWSLPLDRLRAAIVIRAQPGAIPSLIRRPATVLGSQPVPLEDLWDTHAVELAEHLAAEPHDARPAILWRFFADWLARAPLPSGEVLHAQRLLSHAPRTRVRDLARELGRSERQLNRVFLDSHGINPKTFLGNERLALVFEEAVRGARPHHGWLSLAGAYGYGDQSHLLNDCRRRVGLTPSEVLKRSQFHEALPWRVLIEHQQCQLEVSPRGVIESNSCA